jgi:hypothetical protein
MSTDTAILERAAPVRLTLSPRARLGPQLRDEDFVVGLPADCLAELDGVVAEQRKAPVPTLILLPEHFELSACRRWMAGIKERLDHGLGFVILDRMPVDRWSKRELTDIYWLLGSLLEPPVAQDWPGTMIYDVRHDGQPYTGETRTALTPEGLDMHNDSSMGEAPPNYISLLCLNTAKSGGKSSLSSAYAAQNHFIRAPGTARPAVPALLPPPSGVPGGRRRQEQLVSDLRHRAGRRPAHPLQRPGDPPRLRQDRPRAG